MCSLTTIYNCSPDLWPSSRLIYLPAFQTSLLVCPIRLGSSRLKRKSSPLPPDSPCTFIFFFFFLPQRMPGAYTLLPNLFRSLFHHPCQMDPDVRSILPLLYLLHPFPPPSPQAFAVGLGPISPRMLLSTQQPETSPA